MLFNRNYFLGLAFLMSLNSIAFSMQQEQTLVYKVFVENEQKGTLNAKIIKHSSNDYDIRLTTSLKIFFFDIISDIQLQYKKGVLYASHSTKHVNGVQTEHTKVTNKNNYLLVTGSGLKEQKHTDPIPFSVGRLYHAEPKGFDSIFSERLGSKVNLSGIGPNAYELKQPDGTRNYFFYKDGICIEMQTRMRGRKVRFVLM